VGGRAEDYIAHFRRRGWRAELVEP
jgi:hypothetical protein